MLNYETAAVARCSSCMSSTSTHSFGSAEWPLLSPVESYFWRCEEVLDGAFRIVVLLRLQGWIEEKCLAAALKTLQQRHPKLRARIELGTDLRHRYKLSEAAKPIPVEITDCNEADTPWREQTRRLMEVDFPADGPLASVRVLRSVSSGQSELLFAISHAIADGMSAIKLVDDLLNAYAKAEVNAEPQCCLSLPLFTVSRAKNPKRWRGWIPLIRRFLRIKREEKRFGVTSLPCAPDIPPQSQWVHWVISERDTLALIRQCRKEQTSLNSVLMAAVAFALRDCLRIPELSFKWQQPFDVRGALEGVNGPVTAQDLGCFMSKMDGFFHIRHSIGFWDSARQTHSDVQVFAASGGPAFVYNMAWVVHNVVLGMTRLLARPAPELVVAGTDLLASNYGVLSLRDSYGSLRPRECTLTLNHSLAGPQLVTEALVLGQRLNVGFAADKLEPAFWAQLQLAVRKHLDAAISRSAKGSIQPEPRATGDGDVVRAQSPVMKTALPTE